MCLRCIVRKPVLAEDVDDLVLVGAKVIASRGPCEDGHDIVDEPAIEN